jgi:hypothetical protein
MFDTFSLDTTTVVYTFVFLFVVAVIVGISVVLNKTSEMSTPSNIQRISNLQLPALEKVLSPSYKSKTGIIAQNIPVNQKALVNFAPLTVFQPGYLGPMVNGVYKEQEGVTAALKAGARCFVLPIDYHENSGLAKPAFPGVGEPCLLYRDEGGVIRSLNAGSIQKVAQTLANIAFNDVISLKRDPLIVVLYFVRTPTPKTKEYLRYCSKVAKQLNPLIPTMLGQAPEGVYNRQAKQDEILYTALTNLERKTIIMSNIDTSIFRNPKSVGVQTVPITEDLDFMVHLRLYGQTDNPIGATEKVGQNQMPRGYIERLSYYTMIPDKRIPDTMDSNRIRWAITIPSETQAMEVKDLKQLLEKIGVQCVSLPLYTFDETKKGILELWKSTGWIPKPLAARFTRPEPYKPLAPSTKLNANKGQLSSPKI